MRSLIISLSLVLFLSSCTVGNSSTGSTVSGEIVRSLISPDEYNVALQKEIPSPSYGSGKTIVTIYADFQCPACINFSKSLAPIFDSYALAGKATIVYKQFPLTSIHKNAYRDAIAALCSAEQGKYTEAKKALYTLEEERAGATVSDKNRIDALWAVGVDTTELAQCLADNRYARQVDEEVKQGNLLGVNGTPTVLLNGTRLDLGVIFSDMEKGKAFLDRVMNQ